MKFLKAISHTHTHTCTILMAIDTGESNKTKLFYDDVDL